MKTKYSKKHTQKNKHTQSNKQKKRDITTIQRIQMS